MVSSAYFKMADLAKKGNEIMLQEKYDFRPGIQDAALIPTGE